MMITACLSSIQCKRVRTNLEQSQSLMWCRRTSSLVCAASRRLCASALPSPSSTLSASRCSHRLWFLMNLGIGDWCEYFSDLTGKWFIRMSDTVVLHSRRVQWEHFPFYFRKSHIFIWAFALQIKRQLWLKNNSKFTVINAINLMVFDWYIVQKITEFLTYSLNEQKLVSLTNYIQEKIQFSPSIIHFGNYTRRTPE